jgi:hypothetical protein
MEETQNEEKQEIQETTGGSFQQGSPRGVSFPTVGAPRKSGGAKTLLIIGILILVGILGFVIYKSASKSGGVSTEPTPFDNLTTPSEDNTNVSTPAPSATPTAADKAKVTVQVQNGTGITGEAAYLQTQLKNLGYTDVKVGNAGTQDATSTQVTFSKTLDSGIVSELTQKLNSLYQNVTTSTSSSATFDVVIITGLRKGSTAKPSATPTPKATATPAASPTPTATP